MIFKDILTLLIGTAESIVKSRELVEACKKFNMLEIEYININGDPLFDTGYCFMFRTQTGEEARLEIIEIDGNLLQSGFQIIYKPKIFFQKIRKDFSFLYQCLQSYYDSPEKQNYHGTELHIFFNDTSQCYLSKSKVQGQNVLNFRISNKDTWCRYS